MNSSQKEALNKELYNLSNHWQENLSRMLDLVKKGADINFKLYDGNTLAHLAALDNDVNLLKNLIGQGANLNTKNDAGKTVFYSAVMKRSYSVIEYMLKNSKIDVNADSPLVNCFSDGIYDPDFKVVKLLLDYGANIEQTSKKFPSETAYSFAVGRGYKDIADLLKKYGANVKVPIHNDYSQSAMVNETKEAKIIDNKDHIEIKALNKELYELSWNWVENLSKMRDLVKEGADVNAKLYNNNTLAHLALHSNNVDLLKELISKGANLNTKNDAGKTAFYYAAVNGNYEAVKYVLENSKIKINVNEGSPLIESFVFGHNPDVRIVKLLLDHGANIEQTSKNFPSETAYSFAVGRGYKDIANLLKKYGANVKVPIHKDTNDNDYYISHSKVETKVVDHKDYNDSEHNTDNWYEICLKNLLGDHHDS